MKIRHAAVLAVGLVAALSGAESARSQTTGKPLPPLVISSMAGEDLFGSYCASCHGVRGTGGGPTAPALRTVPPDLSTLSLRNGGAFPRGHVVALVTHGEPLATPAHGSMEMPVWGPIFLGLDPSDTRVKVRIGSIVDYVASIQAR